MPTLFTKIIQELIPAYKVFENKYSFAFLDIHPKQKGHILVVPKIEVASFQDLEDPYSSDLWSTSQTLAIALKKVYQSKKIGLVIEGLEVEHTHIHLIPINKPGDLHTRPKNFSSEDMQHIQQQIINHL